MQLREMERGEEAAVLALVMGSFDEFVRPDFSSKGIAEFERSARSFVLDHLDGHCIIVAAEGDTLVGILDVRDGSHIALFFVDSRHHGRGIGRGLLEHVIERCRIANPDIQAMSVNSSPWAVPVYERLGFVAVDVESEFNGIRYVPMVKRLDPTPHRTDT